MFMPQILAGATLVASLAACPLYAATVLGDSQSPINIVTRDAIFQPLDALLFNYATTVDLTLTDTGSPSVEATVRADVPSGSTLTIGGTNYDLLQFHLHASAEHLIDGVAGAMELHLVHRSAAGALAVVGQIIKLGTENTALAGYFDALDDAKGGTATVAGFDLSALLPTDTRSYRYSGSLTAPNASNPAEPFFEPVAWNVLATPIEVSQAQLDRFIALFPDGDARPVQPLNDRIVVTDVAPVPLPASAVLLVAGLGGLLVMRRRPA